MGTGILRRTPKGSCMGLRGRFPACVIAAVWALLATLSPAEPGVSGESGPRLVCHRDEFDFGEVDNATLIRHTFVLRNEGTGDLVVRGIRSSCGCAAATSTKPIAGPGEEIGVEVVLDLRGRTGPQFKTVTVETNDRSRPYRMFYIKGKAVAELALVPAMVNLGELSPRTNAVRSVMLDSRRPGLRIVGVSCDSSLVEAVPWRSDDPRGVGLDVELVPPVPLGVLKCNVSVMTDHPSMRHPLLLPVMGYVSADISVIPRELLFRATDTGPVRRGVLVRGNRNKAFSVVSVSPPGTNVSVKVTAIGSGQYRVDLMNLDPAGFDGFDVVIRTDSDSEPEFRVPIRIVQ
ncbi:MAG: DUF1573 domain-containing protein [Lentisphaerae bacterium]|nr:DUF1573 domain-containing protein [Lentisphaerota bacterium]